MNNQRMIARKVGDSYQLTPATDHPKADATAWAVWGGVLTLLGVQRLNLRGLLLMSIGGGLIYRGVTGRNPLCGVLAACAGRRASGSPSFQNDHRHPSAQEPADDVDEMSMESFPASDPPARHAGTAG